MISALLRKTKFKGVREVKTRLSHYVHDKSPTCITERGEPRSVLIPYQTLLSVTEELEDLKDLVEELKDQHLVGQIVKGRRDYKKGKLIPAEALFKRIGY